MRSKVSWWALLHPSTKRDPGEIAVISIAWPLAVLTFGYMPPAMNAGDPAPPGSPAPP